MYLTDADFFFYMTVQLERLHNLISSNRLQMLKHSAGVKTIIKLVVILRQTSSESDMACLNNMNGFESLGLDKHANAYHKHTSLEGSSNTGDKA